CLAVAALPRRQMQARWFALRSRNASLRGRSKLHWHGPHLLGCGDNPGMARMLCSLALPGCNRDIPVFLRYWSGSGMDFELSEEQRAIQDTARAFAREQMMPFAREWDEEEIFPAATLREAAALGFAGIYVGADVGGSALSRLDAAIIFEELAQGCTSTAAYVSIHNMVGAMIDVYGSTELRLRYLPDLCSMTRFASYCLTEPDAGSDAANLKTRAVRQRDDYVLSAARAFISGGGRSDVYLVMARTGEPGARGISCFLVEKDNPGLAFGAQEKKRGWHSQPTAMVLLEECRVPVADRVGAEGQGFKIAMQGLDGGRLNIAACSLGGAQYCLDRTL